MTAHRPTTEPRTDTDTALRTADVLWSALRDRLEPEEHIGYGRLYEQMYSWMLDRAEAAQGAASPAALEKRLVDAMYAANIEPFDPVSRTWIGVEEAVRFILARLTEQEDR